MPKFNITLGAVQYSYGELIVDAPDIDTARTIASSLDMSDERISFNIVDGETWVDDVCEVS